MPRHYLLSTPGRSWSGLHWVERRTRPDHGRCCLHGCAHRRRCGIWTADGNKWRKDINKWHQMALHCRENMMTLRNTLDIYRISFHMRKHYYAHAHTEMHRDAQDAMTKTHWHVRTSEIRMRFWVPGIGWYVLDKNMKKYPNDFIPSVVIQFAVFTLIFALWLLKDYDHYDQDQGYQGKKSDRATWDPWDPWDLWEFIGFGSSSNCRSSYGRRISCVPCFSHRSSETYSPCWPPTWPVDISQSQMSGTQWSNNIKIYEWHNL